MEKQYRAVEAAYDAQVRAKLAEVESLRRAKVTAVEALSQEKCAKLAELLAVVDFDALGRLDKSDVLFVTKYTHQLKAWTGKTAASSSTTARLTR